jgi:phospholipase/carboxylesterase
LIWLHGLGDTSEGFLDYFQMKGSPLFQGARITLLEAPERAVTINEGDICNSWFDIKTESEEGTDEEKYSIEEIKESLDTVDRFVQREV